MDTYIENLVRFEDLVFRYARGQTDTCWLQYFALLLGQSNNVQQMAVILNILVHSEVNYHLRPNRLLGHAWHDDMT